MLIRTTRGGGFLASAILLATATVPAPAPARPPAAEAPASTGERFAISSDLRVAVRGGREVELLVRLGPDDRLETLAARVTGSAEGAEPLRVESGGEPAPEAEPALWVRVPLRALSDDYRALVLRSLFPQDRRDGADWIHVVRAGRLSTYAEGLWQVAEWFTGDGTRFEALRVANRLASPEPAAGTEIRIPGSMLHPAFHARPRSDDGSLEYGSDARGPYAGYRLRGGEALYSAVVVRFTGRSSAEDVRRLVAEICERSGIRDERDIPVGFLVKIRFDLLEPEYLPREHPRRKEAETARAEMERELARRPVEETRGGLRGVLVVLDPGHGGRDPGTIQNGIWEHDYVYDVTCRLKRKLERETAAEVVLTLEDRETGCAPSSGDRLRKNFRGSVLTDPPFLAREEGEFRMGVNLRWYLANSVYRRAVGNGTRSDRVVFLSLHADSRHPSLRGAMVYVPGAKYRKRSERHNSKTYRKYREVREQPEVRYGHRERIRSEAVSRKLGEAILLAFRDEGLPVQKHQPLRNRVIRGRRAWVPAVIRGNAIPAKVLIEMVNLGNRKDAKLLGRAAERERMADALFAGLFRHFGERPPKPRTERASR